MLDRKTPPIFHRINKINIPKTELLVLDNNVPVHLIIAGKQPIVRIELVFKAGSWFENASGESYFTTKMLSEGTSLKTSAVISNEIDQYGGFLDLSASLDYSIITLECLSRHVHRLLPLLHELIYASIFPEQEFETLKNIKIQQIRVNGEKNNIIASKKLREVIFGPLHPYGKDLTIEDVKNLSLQDIKSFYNNFTSGYLEIFLAGQPEKETLAQINNVFGQQKKGLSDHVANFSITSKDGPTVLEKKSSLQSSIRIGKKLFTKTHPDLIDVLILNEVLGGYFGSRLMKNIREEKGFTYGISSAVLTLKNEGYFIVGTDVKKAFTKETLKEIYKEINILQTDLIPEEELNTVKNYMTGSFLSEINTPFALADKFKSVHLNGLDFEYYNRYIQRVNSISAEELKAIAIQYLKVDTLSEVVVGGLE